MNKIFIVITAVILFSSCDIFNPAEPIPSYVKVNGFALSSNPILGSSSHKILDVYMLIDNSTSLGGFALPCNAPVLASGSHTFTFSPGVSRNGVGANRIIYPFYSVYTETINLVPGEMVTVNPVVTYRSGVNLTWIENFDNSTAGISLIKTPQSSAQPQFLPDGDPRIFEGNNSGGVFLNAAVSNFDLVNAQGFTFPFFKNAIYLEMNYQCNMAFDIGVVATTGTDERYYLITVNPKDSWNKLYVDVFTGVAEQPNAIEYKLYFNGSLPQGSTSAFVLFDNLKILYN